MVDRIEILTYVIRKLELIKGKKALQKIMYFINEYVQPYYTFQWWKYGPFSRELSDDFDFLMFLDKALSYDPNTAEIRVISDEKGTSEISLPENVKRRIDELLEKLREITQDFDPRQLELLASIHFLRHHASGLENKDSVDEIYEILSFLKERKFEKREIKIALQKVRRIEQVFGS